MSNILAIVFYVLVIVLLFTLPFSSQDWWWLLLGLVSVCWLPWMLYLVIREGGEQ